MSEIQQEWLESGETDETDENLGQIDEYDLTSSPNDFNVKTIYDFIDSGAVKIPGFQRNYVWDIRRASKLIESLIIGLPVPQVFLYEEGRNSFLVIDGQQRLMTIYYFIRGRFPRRDKRVEIRRILSQEGRIPDAILEDNEYFDNFNLQLSEISPGRPNKFNKLNYHTLDDHQLQFNLRTIRNVIVKQVRPSNDDSSIYEMFNRLNTGGILLTPQEIRSSLYHSKFYDALARINLDPRWRRLLAQPDADLHMRDVEVLLRGIAIWKNGETYSPSMVKFLNRFSKEAGKLDEKTMDEIETVVDKVLNALDGLPRAPFLTKQQRFSLPFFEAVFAVAAKKFESGEAWTLDAELLQELADSEEFQGFTQEQTTNTSHVKGRLNVAERVLNRARG
ncbi:DUF262 domain-containing protein [Salinibacterium sp. NG22]|uniref:GmrSD restriction endonuclease domain-containing protein n=1 Tax=Salinibacterium sp. NG22 TaxID=2792040 RepID=UPI0018CF3551|nr:DUF262 domain-containing protein [Salinibacterium sp. NG22]MBH0109176.1 DUF262 domain-containing protein [Salinibacterium sp. NG22]